MEIIYTKYSPNEFVRWRREHRGTIKTSDHQISSIRAEVMYTYKFKMIEGKREWLRGVWYGVISAFTINLIRSKKYATLSNESLKKVREKKEVKNAGIESKVFYILHSISILVPEEELEPINIKD
jgi:hypothetical protein